MAFKDRLREAREKAGLDQNEVARLVGNISNTSISNYENGTSFPKTEILYKLFNVLNTSPNFLFQDEVNIDEENNNNRIKITISKKLYEFIDMYESLDKYGKNLIEKVLEMEYERCKNNNYIAKPKIKKNDFNKPNYEDEYHEVLSEIGKKIIEDNNLNQKK